MPLSSQLHSAKVIHEKKPWGKGVFAAFSRGECLFFHCFNFVHKRITSFLFPSLPLLFLFLSFFSSSLLVLFFPLIIFYGFFFFNCWDSAILLAVETVGQGDFGSRWFSIFTHWCICPKREEALLDNMFKWNKLTTSLGSKTRSASLWTKHRTEMQNASLQPCPCWDLGLEVACRHVEGWNMITEISYSTQRGDDIARLTWDLVWGWGPFCLEKILWLSAA